MSYDDSQEKKMMMTAFKTSKLKMTSSDLKRFHPQHGSVPGLGKSVLSRLRKLEQERAEHLEKIESQEKEIQMLRETVSNMNIGKDTMFTIEKIKKENNDLKKYLLSVGMKWEGYEEKDLNLNKFVKGMEQLNIISDRLSVKGNRFAEVPNVPIAVYKDGFMLWRGPFRSFEDKNDATNEFVRDCMSGYFPKELKKRWPHGCRFQITDRKNLTYAEAKRSGEISNNSGIKTMTKLQFLRRLPDSRITKDGRVESVRNRIDIATSMLSSSSLSSQTYKCKEKETEEDVEKKRRERRAIMVEALNRRLGK